MQDFKLSNELNSTTLSPEGRGWLTVKAFMLSIKLNSTVLPLGEGLGEGTIWRKHFQDWGWRLRHDGYEILIRDGKGFKDRVTMLPESLKLPLQTHFAQRNQATGTKGVDSIDMEIHNKLIISVFISCWIDSFSIDSDPFGFSFGLFLTMSLHFKSCFTYF